MTVRYLDAVAIAGDVRQSINSDAGEIAINLYDNKYQENDLCKWAADRM